MVKHNASHDTSGGVLAVAETESVEIRRLRLTLAVERWPGGGATLYGTALGLFLALTQAGETTAAERAHDMAGRKPFALGPLRIFPGTGGLARATLEVALWDTPLSEALMLGSSAALDGRLNVAGHAAHPLDCESLERTDFVRLLHGKDAPCADAEGMLWVRFTTPTVFSWGRGMDGRHRYGLLPTSELVVGSWLRAWVAAGGPDLAFRTEDDWLRERIAVRAVRTLQTVVVHTGKSPVPGFVGEIALTWAGAQPGGSRALRALAGFARFAGTGSKTAYGLGRTEVGSVVHPVKP